MWNVHTVAHEIFGRAGHSRAVRCPPPVCSSTITSPMPLSLSARIDVARLEAERLRAVTRNAWCDASLDQAERDLQFAAVWLDIAEADHVGDALAVASMSLRLAEMRLKGIAAVLRKFGLRGAVEPPVLRPF